MLDLLVSPHLPVSLLDLFVSVLDPLVLPWISRTENLLLDETHFSRSYSSFRSLISLIDGEGD